MGILNQVTQMKSQGMTNQQIVNNLQEQGISPKEIQDAIGQAQIKRAVTGTNTEGMQQSIMNQEPMQEAPMPISDTMQEPMFTAQQPTETFPAETPYQGQDPYAQQDYYSQQPADTYNQQDYYSQQDPYSQEGYGYSTGGSDTTTLIEISEQVFSDKIKKVEKLLDSLNEFKTLTDTKVKAFETRLKRIETTIDQLQLSILEKIGSYGKNLSSIKKEMSMMQDSFGKIINPILDKKRIK
ncbi:MAG: hypothetical protein ABIH59_00495 [archaeon]